MQKLLLFFLLLTAPLLAKEPSAVYLTYTHNPTTSTTVQWQTDTATPTTLNYQAKGEKNRLPAKGKKLKIQGSKTYVHTVELLDLKPDTLYHFTIADSTKEHTFRTLPNTLNRDIRVVVGGDAYQIEPLFMKMNCVIAALDPDFIILGGDIAYTEGRKRFEKKRKEQIRRWEEYAKIVSEQLRAPDGRIIPIIPLIGNHDIQKKKHRTAPPLLFDFLAFPNGTDTYWALDLGNYASFVLLDTKHYIPIAGEQTTWLDQALSSRKHVPHLIPVYHVAAYPSYYDFTSKGAVQVRTHWVPLFEKHRITAAFEHHNHTYKRTHPLLGGKPHKDGIFYLGDGSWGIKPRLPKTLSEVPFIATTKQVNSIWLITLSPTSGASSLTSFDNTGKPIETLPMPKR